MKTLSRVACNRSNVKRGYGIGFTLVELIVVIAIVAVLGAVIAPNVFKGIEKSNIAGTISDMQNIKTAAYTYYADVTEWPENCHSNSACAGEFVTNDNNTAKWDGPYIDKWPKNRWWGSSYAYGFLRNWTGGTGLFTRAISSRLIQFNFYFSAAGYDPAAGYTIAQKIDRGIDGFVNNSLGAVRYQNTGSNIHMLYIISADEAE